MERAGVIKMVLKEVLINDGVKEGGLVKCDQEMGGGVKIGLKKKLVFYSTHN